MKKKNVINLIKYYSEKNDVGFRNEAHEIAREFDENGDYQLGEYIMALLSDANVLIPQTRKLNSDFFRKVENCNVSLPLPEVIKDDVIGVINAIGHNIGVNKFLFEGAPGTGKTETVKQIARILNRELFMVDFDMLVDSKLGKTSRNISELFDEMNSLEQPQNVIILFDEIDALALDRISSNDLREMGRATSTLLKSLDRLNENIVLIATTNLYEKFDKALIRRFDSVVNFDRYTREDLIEIAEEILNSYLSKFSFAGRNIKLFRKILSNMENIPYPGDLKNIIKTSIAFSKEGEEFDYLRRLYLSTSGEKKVELTNLKKSGYTIREMEILSGISKSQVARELKEE
ncbi:MAG: ATP-binding protein [Eubacterium sp.]|nr:ATP-binding protein [Eubacterium sp.]